VRLVLKIRLGAVILLTCQCLTLAQSTKKSMGLTICKLYANPSAYDGTLVRIRAVYAGSFEGSYLLDNKCGKALWFTTPEGNTSVAVSLIHTPYPKVGEANFALVKDKEYEKFERFAYATVENLQPQYRVTAIFTGRIDRCRDFKLGKNGFGNGFGQMGQSEFQFILRSVSDVVVEDAKNGLVLTPSVLSDHLPQELQ
jgi:hypothetical protein